MRRRDFIKAIAGLAASWPLAARAQQAMPVIGFLHAGFAGLFADHVAEFRQSLGAAGYVEGQNVAIEFRWGEDQPGQLPNLANDLVRHKVQVLVASTSAASIAAKAATATIPIVFETGGDPVKMGLVTSFSRPSGNATGITQFTGALEPKRLELLHEVVPASSVIGVLLNPVRPGVEIQAKEIQEAARVLGLEVIIMHARSESDLDTVFATLAEQRIGALLVGADPFFHSRREQLVSLSARYEVPAIYQWRDHAVIGGLMSYGTSLSEAYRQLGNYAARILKGEKVTDLPVVRSTKVELVFNLKTAKALGLTIPLTLLGRADEVIE